MRITEFVFALFMFSTSPATSSVVNGVYKLGCVHQMIFLGMLSLSVYNKFYGTAQVVLPMLLLTVTYMVVCLMTIVMAQVVPFFADILYRQRMAARLRKCGIQYSEATHFYVMSSKTNTQLEHDN